MKKLKVSNALKVFILITLVLSSCKKREPIQPVYQEKKCCCNENKQTTSFKAGAGSVKITPSANVPLAGFAPGRFATGIHDDLYARCLILECPSGKNLAFVSLDLLALLRYDVLMIKKELRSKNIIDPDSVFIFSTHQHSSPDTIGIWGKSAILLPPLAASGRDEKYLTEVRDKIIQLIKTVKQNLKEAEIYVAQTSGRGLSKNIHIKNELDETITAVFVRNKYGSIATLVNFGCHPEALSRQNTIITADFPGYLVKELERKLGGTAMFANGLLGGMVSINNELLKNKKSGFEKAGEIGSIITKRVLVGSAEARRIDNGIIKIQKIITALPIQTLYFQEAIKLGLIPVCKETFQNRRILTEISVVQIGQIKMLMIPGEMLPGLGMKIKSLFNDPNSQNPVIPIGLANDEIGYIIPTEDFNLPIYKYERTMSLGQDTGKIIYDAFKNISER